MNKKVVYSTKKPLKAWVNLCRVNLFCLHLSEESNMTGTETNFSVEKCVVKLRDCFTFEEK